MPSRNEIFSKIQEYKNNGQDVFRREFLAKLSEATKIPTIIYFGSFSPKFPVLGSAVSIDNGDIAGFMTCINGIKREGFKNERLDLILHSPGGSLEAAEQIVQYLRGKFDYIRAIIPQNAMSAATMIACACDEIILGKESAIGPIDPQITMPGQNGFPVSMPAHAILKDFEKAKEDVSKNPNLAAIWAPKILSIPNGMLHFCEKTIELSKEKVAFWLNSYMFRGKEQYGEKIAEWLSDYSEHKTHGRPINYDLAKSKGLNVKRLEDNQKFQDLVLSVYHASLLTFDVTSCVKLIENDMGKGLYTVISPPKMPVFQA